jgi:hypothetical protein
MTSEHRFSKVRNTTASRTNGLPAARELPPAGQPAARELPSAGAKPVLTLDTVPRKTANVERGSDPYNTSGSFDRKKNWARIGKR